MDPITLKMMFTLLFRGNRTIHFMARSQDLFWATATHNSRYFLYHLIQLFPISRPSSASFNPQPLHESFSEQSIILFLFLLFLQHLLHWTDISACMNDLLSFSPLCKTKHTCQILCSLDSHGILYYPSVVLPASSYYFLFTHQGPSLGSQYNEAGIVLTLFIPIHEIFSRCITHSTLQ